MIHGFISDSIDIFNHQQINFCSKIGNYTFDEVTAAAILGIRADTAYLSWEIASKKSYILNGEAWTKFENILYDGENNGLPAVPPPTPTIGTPPTAVEPDMRGRYSDIAAACKRSTGYTNADGVDLGIVAVVTPFVPNDGQPVVTETLHVGHPFLKYVKDQYQGTQIYKDSGDGHGFVKFDKAINATYTDNSALPAAGVAVVWKYKFVYLYQGEEVGTPSLVVEVLVTGM